MKDKGGIELSVNRGLAVKNNSEDTSIYFRSPSIEEHVRIKNKKIVIKNSRKMDLLYRIGEFSSVSDVSNYIEEIFKSTKSICEIPKYEKELMKLPWKEDIGALFI